MKEIRILVADDHVLIRNGIRWLLSNQNEFSADVYEASNGAEVVDLASKQPFDLILLNFRMPKMDGVSAIRSLRRLGINTPVITLCEKCDFFTIREAIDSGALGIILKNIGAQELIAAVKTVSSRLPYYCNEVSQVLLGFGKDKSRATTPLEELTKRERQVLQMIAKELTNDEIACSLKISRRTVEGHRKNLKAKLNVKSTIGLIRYAYESGEMKEGSSF